MAMSETDDGAEFGDLAVLAERVRGIDGRVGKLEDAIDDRRQSSEGIRALLGAHLTDDAARFASLTTLLAVNTKLTEGVSRRAAWSIALLVSLIGLGLTVLGFVLQR